MYNKTLCITVGTLIDGSGQPAIKNKAILIRNGIIMDVMPRSTDILALENLIDLSGKIILPALIDSHVHLNMSGTLDPDRRKHQLTADFGETKSVIEKHLIAHRSYGIIAVRDGGDHRAHTLRYKTNYLNNQRSSLLKAAGKAWINYGRYGKLIGRPPCAPLTLSEAIHRDLTNEDHVKIVNSGLNSLTHFGRQTAPQFTVAEMRSAVAAANAAGRPVMVHANGKHPVDIALDAGCSSIEHGFFMGEKNLADMARKQIFWVPTAATMSAYAQSLDPESKEAHVAMQNYHHQLKQLSYAHRQKTPTAIGTDAGSMGVHHGKAIISEMHAFKAAGYTVEETVKCATSNGAELLGLNDIGRLSKGKRAIFVAVGGNVSDLPESLATCELYDFFSSDASLSPNRKLNHIYTHK